MTPEAVARPELEMEERLLEIMRRRKPSIYFTVADLHAEVIAPLEAELARLRIALATAERERASAVEQYERTHEELTGYATRAEELGARAASLDALLTEAGKALGKIASAAALSGVRGANMPKTTCGAVYELDEALTGARAVLARLDAGEGGEEKSS